MEALKIIVSLDSATAIRLGQAQAGETAYPLAGVLHLLDDATREWVADHGAERGGEIRLPTHPYAVATEGPVDLDALPTDETVAQAIVQRRESYEAIKLEKAVEEEARIQCALAAPDADWLGTERPWYYTRVASGEVSSDSTGHGHGRPRVCTVPSGVYLTDEQKTDPRIVARRAEVESRALPAAIEAWEAKYAEWETACASREAREAEAAAAKEAAREALRQWASTCNELPARIRRAASDGLNVYPAVKRYLGDAVRACLLEIAEPLGGDIVDTYGTPETSDRVPSDEAYAILDALTEAKEQIAAAALVPGVEVTVGPFARVDVFSLRATMYRSAVDVTVNHPWLGDLGDYVLTEPANLPEAEDDDD